MIEIKRAITKDFNLEIKENEEGIIVPWVEPRETPIDSIRIFGVFHLLSAEKRIELLEWAWKSLIPGGQLLIQVPAWYHGRSYTDPGVVWPPLCAEFFLLASKGFRQANMPHVDMECDFSVNAAFAYDVNDQFVAFRNEETKANMLGRNVNTCTEFHIAFTKPYEVVNG